jgi:hypothetical protein
VSARPSIGPVDASTMLALLDSARANAPGCESAWLRGYLTRAAGERVAAVATATPEQIAAINERHLGEHALRTALRADPRVEPGTRLDEIGRIDIVKRPP